MLYKDPLLETYKVYFEVPQNFIIQSIEFRHMGRSGICINFNAMEQMWIDKGKINRPTLKAFIRQPLSKPIKNASILLQFLHARTLVTSMTVVKAWIHTCREYPCLTGCRHYATFVGCKVCFSCYI